jgi:hypothetical protein
MGWIIQFQACQNLQRKRIAKYKIRMLGLDLIEVGHIVFGAFSDGHYIGKAHFHEQLPAMLANDGR